MPPSSNSAKVICSSFASLEWLVRAKRKLTTAQHKQVSIGGPVNAPCPQGTQSLCLPWHWQRQLWLALSSRGASMGVYSCHGKALILSASRGPSFKPCGIMLSVRVMSESIRVHTLQTNSPHHRCPHFHPLSRAPCRPHPPSHVRSFRRHG